MNRTRRNRERGTALILVMVVFLVVTAFGSLLISIPKAGFDREVQLEEKEGSLLAADAGLRGDALLGLNNGWIKVGPGGYTLGTPDAPRAFGKRHGGYWYTISQQGGGNVLRVEAYGVHGATLGVTQGNRVTSHVQAVLARETVPAEVAVPGALTMLGNTDPTWTIIPTFKITGSGNQASAVNGVDATDPPTPNTLGVAFTGYKETPSFGPDGNSSSAFNEQFGKGNLIGGAAGSGAFQGNSVSVLTAAKGQQLQDLITNTLANPPADATIVKLGSGETYKTSSLPSSGTADTPVVVIIQVTGTVQDPLVTVTSDFYGILLVDMAGATGFNGNKKGNAVIGINANSTIHGLTMLNGPTGGGDKGIAWDPSFAMFRRNGASGAFSGGVAMKMNKINSGADVPVADLNGQGAVQYSSGDVAIALKAVAPALGDYKLVAYRIVQ